MNHRAPLLLLMTCVPGILAAADTPAPPASGIDLKAIDTTVNPCVDFYRYACGSWAKNNQIPPEFSSWGRFQELAERNQAEMREVADDAGRNLSRSPLDQKVGVFYATCMDEAAADKAGVAPIEPEIDRIRKISQKADLAAEVARLHNRGVGVLFRFGPEADPDNSRMYIPDIDQGGLGLPERDFYFRTDPKSVELRAKYQAHISKLLQLAGEPAAKADEDAAAILAFETELAKSSLDVVSRRNPHLLVHKMPVAEFTKLAPGFDFKEYLAARAAPAFPTINVSTPDFLKGLNTTLDSTPLDVIKVYLAWHYISANAPLLSKPFVDEDFNFNGLTLTGAKVIRPRWKRCITLTDRDLGELLGQKFVEKYFGVVGKQKTLEMVGLIERAMATDIDSLTWMSDATKQQAFAKLKEVTNKIGYPEKWRDYTSVKIVPDDSVGNATRALEVEMKRRVDKIGQPVDRLEWGMTPPTVNAYYSPGQNNINFPAGILQPPFFTPGADMAVNFGGIGVVVGHELTHGFDDQGRQYDGDGNLREWWTPQDAAAFKKRVDCISDEYSGFAPLPDVHINGKLTLGENGADNAGMRLAYMALMTSLDKNTVSSERLDGFTPQQRFFLGFGQIWCINIRDEALRVSLRTNPHSPGMYRVNGTVQNTPEFSTAFGCKEGDPMFADPAKACRVW
jgi:putative endopeptidase